MEPILCDPKTDQIISSERRLPAILPAEALYRNVERKLPVHVFSCQDFPKIAGLSSFAARELRAQNCGDSRRA